VSDFISAKTADLLRQSRDLAFRRSGTSIDLRSDTCPALFLYSGTMYSIEGFREEVHLAIDRGMHVLVESGGYGLVRAEEPIHKYEAQMNRTAPVWRRVLPAVLNDYVKRNHIDEVFIAGSKQYASVLRHPQWWNSVRCRWFIAHAGRGNGNPYEIVPHEIGVTVRDLLRAACRPDSRWTSTGTSTF